MTIQVLSEQLASQIAAGEVVERPASVVKELVENSLDAGATSIQIDIRQGGRKLIQISDNGCGISAREVKTAFLRHATSKLRAAEDLTEIATLGFRGEALAAISAVSQSTIVTREKEEEVGTRLSMEGGHIAQDEQVGAPKGTVISIENLFYNVPARLKFLKTIPTEKRLIDEFVTKYAMAYPHVRFRLTHDGRITFQTSGSGNLRDVLVAIYGAEIARELLPLGKMADDRKSDEEMGEWGDESFSLSPRPPTIPSSNRPIAVTGFAAPPSIHRANRNHITLFVNGRWIKDKNLTYAIIQAYHTLLPIGRYPLAVVFVSMPLAQVDVNVHPMKTEVRFTEPGRVFAAVQKTVRSAVIEETPVRSIRSGHFESLTTQSPWAGREKDAFRGGLHWDFESGDQERAAVRPGFDSGQMALDLRRELNQTPIVPSNQALQAPPMPGLAGDKLPIMRVVGQIGASYIITEGPEGMYLIDQHAAHERVQYENFMGAHARQEIPSQGLVAGAPLHLSPDQAALLDEQMPLLASLGFQIEPFGPQAFMIRSVPAVVAHQDPTRVLNDIVADLERGDAPMQAKVEDKIIRRVCKTASIKAGQSLSNQEMEALIQQLEQCQNPHTCPHGRPTLIFLSVTQLAKEFGR
ncbi:MAG: DNA mismatch repair endonuclease MutL [Chloroflexota bacterium]